jgi:hypothetical protein
MVSGDERLQPEETDLTGRKNMRNFAISKNSAMTVAGIELRDIHNLTLKDFKQYIHDIFNISATQVDERAGEDWWILKIRS